MCSKIKKVISVIGGGSGSGGGGGDELFHPKFGVLVNGSFTVYQKADIAVSLGASCARNAVTVEDWTGGDHTINSYDAYTAAGLDVIMNINWKHSESAPQPFVTSGQLAGYLTAVEAILTAYPPAMVVVENEPPNKNYHTGPMSDYSAMLVGVGVICDNLDIPFTDGGVYGTGLEVLVYRWLKAHSRTTEMNSFGTLCMKPATIKAANNVGSNSNVEAMVTEVVTILNADVSAGAAYANLHLYESFSETENATTRANKTSISPNVIALEQEYIKAVYGLDCITNETGQRDNSQPMLVTNMLKEYRRLQFPYVLWFSGDGAAGATPLQNPDGSLKPNGLAFYNEAIL